MALLKLKERAVEEQTKAKLTVLGQWKRFVFMLHVQPAPQWCTLTCVHMVCRGCLFDRVVSCFSSSVHPDGCRKRAVMTTCLLS